MRLIITILFFALFACNEQSSPGANLSNDERAKNSIAEFVGDSLSVPGRKYYPTSYSELLPMKDPSNPLVAWSIDHDYEWKNEVVDSTYGVTVDIKETNRKTFLLNKDLKVIAAKEK